MKVQGCFGPWATAMSADTTAELSRFWKRRMAMLGAVGQAQRAPSRRQALALGLAGLLAAAAPTLCAQAPAQTGVAAVAAQSGSEDERPATLSLKQVVAGVEGSLGRIESMRVTYHRSAVGVEGERNGPWPFNRIDFAFKGQKRYLDHTRTESDGYLFRQIAAYDGEATRDIFGTAGGAYNRGRTAPVELDFYTMYLFLPIAKPPGLESFHLDTTDRWLPHALYRPGWRVLERQEQVDGAWCHVLELPKKQRLWIDPNVGFAVRKREFYREAAGAPVARRYTAGDFVEGAERVWLPKRVVYEGFLAPPAQEKIGYRDEINVSSVEVNNVPDSLFDVDALDVKRRLTRETTGKSPDSLEPLS